VLPIEFAIMLIIRRRRKCFWCSLFPKKATENNNYRCDRSKLKTVESKKIGVTKFGGLLDYKDCISSSRKPVISLEKRKLRLLV